MNSTANYSDADVVIMPFNEVYASVDCPRHIAYELSEQFVFKAENYKFHPKYKKRIWDGNIRLFSANTKKLYIGLIDDSVKYCNKMGYSVYIHPDLQKQHHYGKDEIKAFLESLEPYANGQRIYHKDYQIDAVYTFVNQRRGIIKSPTGSGKSLIIYSLIRWFEHETDKKQLVIVPTISLVTQMGKDFSDYSCGGVDARVYEITSGVSKDIPDDKDIVITTWQSISKMPSEWYEQFYTIIADEAHQYKAVSLKGIMENAVSCPVRIGTTGTTGKVKSNVMTLQALFGRIVSFTSTKKLMDRKDLSNLEIHGFVLNYGQDEGRELRKTVKEAKKKNREDKSVGFRMEKEFIYSHALRMKFLGKVVKSAKGKNVLILFDQSEYGKRIFETMQKWFEDKHVFFVDQTVKKQDREEIRNFMEKHDDCVLVASYGTTSTGVNIRNLFYVVFASPTKSMIRVLQSIGRGLRKHKNKEKTTLVDLADNLSTKSQKNYCMKHFMERLKVYAEEGFDFKIREVELCPKKKTIS